MKKHRDTLIQIITWFENNDPFANSRNKDHLVSFSAGLVSTKDDAILYPELAQQIGNKMQKTLDGKTIADTLKLSLKIKPFVVLKRGL